MEHNIKIGIDATPASRGAAQFVTAINQITTATKAYQSAITGLTRNSGKNNFSKMAQDLRELGSLKVSGSQTDNLNNLSNALKGFKGPSSAAVKNTRSFMAALAKSSVSSSSMRAVEQFSMAMSNFKGPSRSSVSAVQSLLTTLSRANINPATGAALASVTAALSNFKGPSKTSAASVSQLLSALGSARISPSTASAISGVGTAFANFKGPSSSAAKNLSAFLGALSHAGSIPNLSSVIAQLNQLNLASANVGKGVGNLGQAMNRAGNNMRSTGSSAVALTGNMRGLENAMSVSYQLGSQLRVLFGSLTFAEFTKGVYEATLAQQRFNTTLGVTAKSQAEAAQSMEFATSTADKYGISLTNVYDEYGKFSTAAKLAGQSTQNVQFIFESMSGAMRVMGTDAMGQQRVFRALTQMFSKGAVMAEELRQQLGEQLPGAFELMQQALSDYAGKPVDLNKLLQEGKVDDSAVVLMAQKIMEVFGPQVEAALARADAQIGKLANTWTKFQITVGSNGVQDAIGDVAKRLNEVMSSDAFQENAIKLAQGLGDAIRLLGDAAIWAVNNARGLATTITAVLAYSGANTTVGLLTNLATAATKARGAIGLVGLTFGAIPAAIGAATLALGLYGDEQIKIGDQTFTLNELAIQAFHDIKTAASLLWDEFQSIGTKAQEAWNIINSMTFADVIDAGANMTTALMQGFGFVSQSSATAAAENAAAWSKSFALAAASGQAFFTRVATDGAKIAAWIKNNVKAGAAMTFGTSREDASRQFIIDTKADFDAIQAVADQTYQNIIKQWDLTASDLTGGFSGAIKNDLAEYSKYAREQAEIRNQQAREAARLREEEEKRRKAGQNGGMVSKPNLDGINPFRGGGLDVSDKTSVGKRLKEEAKAIANYTAEIKDLTTALAAGKITLEQFNAGMEAQAQKLQETKDPYAAMVRSMEDELKVSGMATKAREIEIEHRTKINELAEKGVYVTQEMSDKIKDLITQQQKMNNQPLRQWVDGIEEFGVATDRVAVKALDNMADSIAELVVTGKADFASLAQSILKDFIRAGISKLYKDFFSNMFGGTKEVEREKLTKPVTSLAEAQAQNIKTQADTWELKGGLGTNGAGPVKNGAFQSQADLDRETALNGLTAGSERLRGSFDTLGNSTGTFEASMTKATPQLDQMTTGSINATNALNQLATAAAGATDAQKAAALGQPMPAAPGTATSTAGMDKVASLPSPATLSSTSFSKTLEAGSGFAQRAYESALAAGVPDAQARLMAAQATLESGHGKSQLSTSANNYFGMKAGSSWKGDTVTMRTREETASGKTYYEDAKFRKYATPADSFKDHAEVVQRRWPEAYKANTFEGAVAGLRAGQQGGYATDKNYASKVASINAGLRTPSVTQPVPVKLESVGTTGAGAGGFMSAKTLERLGQLDPNIQAVVKNAQQYMPAGQTFQIGQYGGLRTEAMQRQMVNQGLSKTMNSNHRTGRAVDLDIFNNGKYVGGDHKAYGAVEAAMKRSASELGVPMNWGGDWKGSWDKPHWELQRGWNGKAGQPAMAGQTGAPAGVDPQTTASIDKATQSLQQLGTEAQNVAQKTQQSAQQQQMTTQQTTMANQQKIMAEQQSAMATQQAGASAQSSAPQFTAAGQAIASAGQQAGQGAQAAQAGLGQLGGLLSSIPGVGQYVGMANQIMGIFGMGLFEEGGMATKPVKTMSIPHYAEGTANTSGGMPAVLHPNEAVIPLSRGRKIPVDINSGSEQKGSTEYSREAGSGTKQEIHFHGIKDADGFKQSKRDIQAVFAGRLQRDAQRQN